MYIPLDMKNTDKTKNNKLSEDQKEMIWILLAFVVMAIIFWFMLISDSGAIYRDFFNDRRLRIAADDGGADATPYSCWLFTRRNRNAHAQNTRREVSNPAPSVVVALDAFS